MAIQKFTKISPLLNISFLVSFVGIILGLFAQFILPPEVPLLYGLPHTEGQLVPNIWIILPSSLALIVTLINGLIAMSVQDSYLKKTLSLTSIFCSVLAVITTIKIIFLVGSI